MTSDIKLAAATYAPRHVTSNLSPLGSIARELLELREESHLENHHAKSAVGMSTTTMVWYMGLIHGNHASTLPRHAEMCMASDRQKPTMQTSKPKLAIAVLAFTAGVYPKHPPMSPRCMNAISARSLKR